MCRTAALGSTPSPADQPYSFLRWTPLATSPWRESIKIYCAKKCITLYTTIGMHYAPPCILQHARVAHVVGIQGAHFTGIMVKLGHREIRELCTTRSLGVLQLATLIWTGRKVQWITTHTIYFTNICPF